MLPTPPASHQAAATAAGKPPRPLTPLDVVNDLEGPDCDCFRDWDPEQCAGCGHAHDKHGADGCEVRDCACTRYRPTPPPSCQHVQGADHKLGLTTWAAFQSAFLPDAYQVLLLPASHTDAVPGTQEKLAVMAERIANGESAFHPQDKRVRRPDEEHEEHEEWELVAFSGNGSVKYKRRRYRQGG